MKLSTVILTHNFADQIEKTLQSVSFADELILINDNPDSSSAQFGKEHKLNIINHSLSDDFAQQRNFGMQKAQGNWILFVDSDEVVSSELRNEIEKIIAIDRSIDAYYIRRRDFFWNHEMKFGETRSVRSKGIIRLVKRNSGAWKNAVHEVFETTHKKGSLHGFLDHYPHPTVTKFLSSINHYSSLRARELKNNGKKFSLLQLVFYPPAKFIYTYIFKLGFLDGPAGFVYSFMMSFHSFLVRAKLLNL